MIYTVIARQEVMLCDYTSFSGNFVLTTQEILKRSSSERKYVKYAANNYVFYLLNIDITYLVMCDHTYSERIAFSYLEKIQQLFSASIPSKKALNGGMYSCMEFSHVLKENMELYSTPEQVDNVARLWKETQQVNQIVNEDLQRLIERGEKIQVLVKKTESMSSMSLDLSVGAKTLKRQMVWRNCKWKILMILTAFVAIYLIMVIICGGFSLSGCF